MIKPIHMKPQHQEYEGHHIEQREREGKPELLIDKSPVPYGQLPDGLYFLHEYAFDWSKDLMDLARKFIGYRRKVKIVQGERESGKEGSDMRYRKNYRDLTNDERNRFVQALYHLKSTGVVDQFANEHETFFHRGIHRTSHFLPWHRDFLRRFEDALRTYHPDITIPYWNSTVDTSPSDPLWDNAFLGQFDASWGLGRALGSATLPTPQQVQTTLGLGTYDAFSPDLEKIIHNPPHNWVSGVMTDYASPGDPVFYLHHCWIDLLWAQWQLLNPDAAFVSYQKSDAGFGLNDPMASVSTTPAEVLDHLCINLYNYPLGFKQDMLTAPPWWSPGLRAARVNRCLTNYNAQLTDLAPYFGKDGILKFAFIMNEPTKAWGWVFGLTADEVGDHLETYNDQITDISPYFGKDGILKFAVIFTEPTEAWGWHQGLTADEVGDHLKTYNDRLTRIRPYRDTHGILKFAAIFTKPKEAWGWVFGLTADEVGDHLKTYNDQITDLSPYFGKDGILKFAVIFTEPKEAWGWSQGLTAAQVGYHLKKYNDRLTRIRPYRDTDGILKFAVIFAGR